MQKNLYFIRHVGEKYRAGDRALVEAKEADAIIKTGAAVEPEKMTPDALAPAMIQTRQYLKRVIEAGRDAADAEYDAPVSNGLEDLDDILDAKPAPKPRKRTYRRRDLKAEE